MLNARFSGCLAAVIILPAVMHFGKMTSPVFQSAGAVVEADKDKKKGRGK